MTTNTTAGEIIEIFESSFRDKEIIPLELELKWLDRAVAWYCQQEDYIEYNPKTLEFGSQLDMFAQSLIAQYMRVYYQEREVSKVNRRVSIVTKDISIDGKGYTKNAAKAELEYHKTVTEEMEHMMFTTAYGNDDETSETE